MGDFNGANYADDFVGDLVNFVAGESFQTMFETFFLTYALEFSNDEEHKLRYYELYQTFHDMFESQLETFCSKKNITQAEFMIRCRGASSEDAKAKHYIEILLSSVEYDTFVKLMRIMRPVAQSRKMAEEMIRARAEAKAKAEADGEVYEENNYGSDIKDTSPAKASAKDDDIERENSGSKGWDEAESKGSNRDNSPEKAYK